MTLDTYSYIETAAARVPAPLLVALHGTGGDEHQLLELARALVPEAAILAPRGDVSEHGHLRFFRRKAEGVYDFDDLNRRSHKMADFVRAHKARLRPSRTIGLGYSNGANILAAVTFGHADLFDDLVLMHPLVPWVPADNPALARLRVLITAGRHDPICPVPRTQALATFLKSQGVETRIAWHDGGHEWRPEEQVEAQRFLAETRSPPDIA
jgi:phospholipase/carboxylesterase